MDDPRHPPIQGHISHQAERREERHPLGVAAPLRRGMRRETVEILNLSASGALLRALDPLRVGYDVWLKLPGLDALQATVTWVDGFTAGAKFERPLHPAVLERVLGQS